MLDLETIKRVADLAEAKHRTEAAAALAVAVGAVGLFVLVEDRDVDALLPAPGLAQTGVGGPLWRAFLKKIRAPGTHRGEVAYPSHESIVKAVACSGSGIALVFVGEASDSERIETVCMLLPLVGSTLRAEYAAAAAGGELAVAREDARHASVLARSLDSARADLERQAKSLDEARARAEEAIRAKDEFLAMLGHELRNPLAPITTALHLMRLRGGTPSREQEILERQVGQLMRLVDDLLDVARIARGKVELRKEVVELRSIATRTIEIASPLLEQRQQRLTVDVPAEGLLVDADADRLAQVFSNLLTNAAKYSDTNTHVRFSARQVGDKIVVRVQDEGQGIAPHMVEAVFEHFVQQKQSLGREQGGLGLGLAIVKNLVVLHGGTVRAESEGRGKGSAFIVELPLAERVRSSEAPRAPLRVSALRSGRQHERILLVDDNVDAAAMLSEALTYLGYVVRTAYDGPSALVAADEFQPEVALLDIGLPVMDGYELARQLRESHAALRLVALTGYGQASDKAQAREAGFDGHLVKPLDLEKLQWLLSTLPPAWIATEGTA